MLSVVDAVNVAAFGVAATVCFQLLLWHLRDRSRRAAVVMGLLTVAFAVRSAWMANAEVTSEVLHITNIIVLLLQYSALTLVCLHWGEIADLHESARALLRRRTAAFTSLVWLCTLVLTLIPFQHRTLQDRFNTLAVIFAFCFLSIGYFLAAVNLWRHSAFFQGRRGAEVAVVSALSVCCFISRAALFVDTELIDDQQDLPTYPWLFYTVPELIPGFAVVYLLHRTSRRYHVLLTDEEVAAGAGGAELSAEELAGRGARDAAQPGEAAALAVTVSEMFVENMGFEIPVLLQQPSMVAVFRADGGPGPGQLLGCTELVPAAAERAGFVAAPVVPAGVHAVRLVVYNQMPGKIHSEELQNAVGEATVGVPFARTGVAGVVQADVREQKIARHGRICVAAHRLPREFSSTGAHVVDAHPNHPKASPLLVETLTESPFTFKLPATYLALRTCEPLAPERYLGLADEYLQHGGTFKSSRSKKDPQLLAVPTNLHVHSWTLRGHCYDIVTMGVPAAHALGFKHGGLRARRAELAAIIDTSVLDVRHAASGGLLHSRGRRRPRSSVTHDPASAPAERSLSTASQAAGEAAPAISERFDAAFSQALTGAVTAASQWLVRTSALPPARRDRICELVAGCGLLLGWESLISTHGKELGMLEDMDVVIKYLKKVSLVLTCTAMRAPRESFSVELPGSGEAKEADEQPAAPVETNDTGLRVLLRRFSSYAPLPQADDVDVAGEATEENAPVVEAPALADAVRVAGVVRGSAQSGGGGFEVTLDICPDVFRRLPAELTRAPLRLVPVLFQQGINEMQTVANKVGDASLQDQINAESLAVFKAYHESYCRQAGNAYLMAMLSSQMRELEDCIANAAGRRTKAVRILQLAAALTRAHSGARITMCKSAKDRTSMSVTLEMVRVLELLHGLPERAVTATLASLRARGVRRDNALKNVGVPRFAFNRVQWEMLPKEYRPPVVTIGAKTS